MKRKILGQLAVLMIAGITAAVFAQAQVIPEPVSLVASNRTPSPDETVLIQASTPTGNTAATTFGWTINGRPRPDLSGIGKNSVSIRAGSVGTEISVSVMASRGGSAIGNASINILVADLTLVWSAETLIPPWYKGRALPVAGSIVRIAAIPDISINGTAILPENLIYRWDVDDRERVLVGAGKQVFRLKMSDLSGRSHNIVLSVSNIEGTITKTSGIFLSPQPRAFVTIYKTTPLGGVEPRSGNLTFSVPKNVIADFIAEPFFFPVTNPLSLSYDWFLEDISPMSDPKGSNRITVNTNTATGDTAGISVSVDDQNPVTPSAFSGISVIIE